jgi:hypothetical protein
MRIAIAASILLVVVIGSAQARDPGGRAESSRDSSETRINRIYEQPGRSVSAPSQPAAAAAEIRTQNLIAEPKKKKVVPPRVKPDVSNAPATTRISPR